MNFNISWLNLWFPFVLGYGLIWIYMITVNKKRGSQIEDSDGYKEVRKSHTFLLGFLPTVVLFVAALFVPMASGIALIFGLIIYIVGLLINLIAMQSFISVKSGLNDQGIYKYSRNPMYVGGILFVFGLNVIGWSDIVMSLVFLFCSLLWVLSVHLNVLTEERFLSGKYGEEYKDFSKRVPRYIGIIKNS